MKIGLYAPDSKIPNLALMKFSAYFKQQGNHVEFFKPILDGQYDAVYISKIFKNTSIKYLPHKQQVFYGGSGFQKWQYTLPVQIEHIYPDYDLYKIDYAMGFITRGCPNHCAFCIVPKKEGDLQFNAHLEEFWLGQKKLMLLDNAITDCETAIPELIKIRDLKIQLELTQGFNIRTIQPEIAKILAEIKLWKSNCQWHIAWDNPADQAKIFQGIRILESAGIKCYRLMCYCLVGFNTSLKQDLARIQALDKIDVDPFVMRYRKTASLNALAKWCNRPAIRHSCSFQEFSREKKLNLIW